ncbi:PadR family transcriptional regulator [Arthrobacter sp. H14-L1]|uniref:PadR family transcriptional regulator n=1 Tax=Arthrobacter sp. H14-L1 TaxID=2996697 RepID=UPI00226F54F8|nr:PadR family transcriptional regulator [Arthrobacter sp. H14-L1]MCY0904673.1 PadR family transcriptional regulator [Arthrobacter sp. H14-L1]
MSLPHAILTSLLEKPGSGAELAQRFDKSIGYFWQATHQQIYRELARLEERGLIRSAAREATRGRKRDFAVIPAGLAELERWTSLAQDPQPVRDALLVRLRAAAVIQAGTVQADTARAGILRAELARHRELHQRQLSFYQAVEAHDFAAGSEARAPGTPDHRLQHAVLRAGIMFERAWVSWAEETLRTLEP